MWAEIAKKIPSYLWSVAFFILVACIAIMMFTGIKFRYGERSVLGFISDHDTIDIVWVNDSKKDATYKSEAQFPNFEENKTELVACPDDSVVTAVAVKYGMGVDHRGEHSVGNGDIRSITLSCQKLRADLPTTIATAKK